MVFHECMDSKDIYTLWFSCAGGLDEALHTIIDTCREQGIPFVFALSRKSLGRCVNKAVPVSLVGIFNYDGAQVWELISCLHFSTVPQMEAMVVSFLFPV